MEARKKTTGSARPKSGGKAKKKNVQSKTLSTLIYVSFVIGVSVILATVAWVTANDMFALNKSETSAIVTLPESVFITKEVTNKVTDENGKTVNQTTTVTLADVDYVADYLKENGIIEFKSAFKLFSAFSNADTKIVAGTYELDTTMDYRAIITNLSAKSASRMTVQVTIPEGYTVAQIFQCLEDNEVSTVAKLNDMAANYDYGFSFLQDIPLGDPNRLEGYLFPDTYEFYLGEDPKWAINKMMVNFDRKFTDDMRAKAVEMGYSVHDMVILASLIEKETDGTDQKNIASVMYNRLDNPGAETVGLLQIDAGIAYVTGRVVTVADYSEVDSPYNTYLNKGLPPGPIANPGMAAINAVFNPANTNYYYYVLGKDGLHHYFRTHQEQLNYIASMRG